MRFLLIVLTLLPALAQPTFGPGGGPGGFGGPGGPGQHTELLKDFDKDGDGHLNADERKAAREHLAKQPRRGAFGRGGFRGGGPPGGPGGPASAKTFQPGPKLKPEDVKRYTTEPLYDPAAVRTLFLEFEDADWEQALTDFYHSDVDIPAKLTVDGKVYPGVGVHFRGMTSFMMVPSGGKRSLDISVNFLNADQRLNGYRSLNLLNASGDPTFLRTALYHHIARQYIPAPKANWSQVVINGESWGIFVNTQQTNADFVRDFYQTTKGTRWKISGSPRGQGGLSYLGDNPDAYRKIYSIKSKDDPKAWAALIQLCKTLNQTPPENLAQALEPMLDLEGALKFLAIDKALINNDGFWSRASDYSLYLDPKGRFHLIPWDANETLRETERMGFGRALSGEQPAGNAELDPFAGADDASKALLAKLVAVPALRARYLGYLRDIAEKWLDWKTLGPLAAKFQSYIADGVAADTRKLYSTAGFRKAVTEDNAESGSGPTAPPHLSLQSFCEQRSKFLLSYPGIRRE